MRPSDRMPAKRQSRPAPALRPDAARQPGAALEFSLRGLPELVFKDTYAGETDRDVLSLAQGLVDECKISSMLKFATDYGDLYHSLKSRGMVGQLRRFEENPVQPPPQLPKRLPLEDFTLASARNLDLRGRGISPPQMYRLICYVCFSLGTNKAALGGVCSDDTTVKNKMRQKLSGDKEAGALFESCLQRMRSSGAITETKRSKGFHMLTINVRQNEITDDAVREAVSQALAEHRRLFNGR